MQTDLPQTGREMTVVIADDHAIVREGFAALCISNGLRILGQASDGAAAFELISTLKPDVAILDLHMPPGITGIEVIRRLRSAGCKAKLMILSVSREESAVMEALRAGADGYLLKDGPARHWQDAIAYVIEGGVYVSPLIHGGGEYATPDRNSTAENKAADPLATLTARESEVFSYLVNGVRAGEIAKALDISPKTVDSYRASLMRKLNVADVAGLVRFATERDMKRNSGKNASARNTPGRRSDSGRLRPPEWQRLKLKAAIENLWEASAVPRRFKSAIHIEPLPREPEQEIKFLLGRAAQEALSNIKEHARASRVELTLSTLKLPARGGGLVLTVRDDGAGFDVGELSNGQARISWGIGLRLIREQALALGGSFKIESGPRGTTFEVLAPFTPGKA